MNGHLQQIIALAINGNAAQRGIPIDGFWPNGGAFVFDNETSFHVFKKGWFKQGWVMANSDPISWLTENGAGYRIHCVSRSDPNISDRMASGFANGGPRWLIEAVRDQKSSFWEGSMEVSSPNAADNKIWATRYYCVERDLPTEVTRSFDLEVMRGQMHDALDAVHAFAKEHNSGFANSFAKALGELDSIAPAHFGWEKDLLPAGFEISLSARKLLSSAQIAYVFGGMGSWNDQYWPEADIDAEYHSLSDRLFACLNNALVAATNSTYSGS